MTIIVTEARPEHTPAVLTLLEELDQFYGATTSEPLDKRAAQLHQALFSDPPAAHVLLAFDGDEPTEPVGIASCSFLWPAVGLTRSLYLKELYVTRTQRRAGVGTALMRALFDMAAKYECSRIEWTTDTDNPDAQRFYTSLGLQQLSSKIFFRADATTIERRLR